MAKKKRQAATRLPSGKYRVQVLVNTDPDGKRHYKSFTADTAREAVMLAEAWKIDRPEDSDDITLLEAVERYIAAREAVLSPSTLRGYHFIVTHHLQGRLGHLKLSEVTNTALQTWISDLVLAGHSPKSVRNKWGLVSATVDMFLPDFQVKVKLPQKLKEDRYCPSDEDIQKLLQAAARPELKAAIMLAAFGTLRRGEVCALTVSDIHQNYISVNKDIVRGADGCYYTKPPKTTSSTRNVELPDFVMQELRKLAKGKAADDRLIGMNPDTLSPRFTELVEKTGLPPFSFHDLRHYSASILHAIGVPDQYIMQRGGWATDNVMKAVYRNVIDLEKKKQNRKIMHHFDEKFAT